MVDELLKRARHGYLQTPINIRSFTRMCWVDLKLNPKSLCQLNALKLHSMFNDECNWLLLMVRIECKGDSSHQCQIMSALQEQCLAAACNAT